MAFKDRVEAGRLLAEALAHLRGSDVVVLGLPRGGVPVAFEVARALDAPLDVIVVRKVGVPWQPELAMGAVGEDGASIVNAGVVRAAREPSAHRDAPRPRRVVGSWSSRRGVTAQRGDAVVEPAGGDIDDPYVRVGE